MTKVESRPERRPSPPASLLALTAHVVFLTRLVRLESLTTSTIAPELVERLDSP